MTSFKKGDRVTPARDDRVPPATYGRVFLVRKVNPKNIQCDAEDGGRGINFPAELLLPATEENIEGDGTFGVPYQPREFFCAGEIVTLVRAFSGATAETPLVVLKDDGQRKVNVAKLGGDDNHYLRIGPSGLVKRDSAWLAERLLEEATRVA